MTKEPIAKLQLEKVLKEKILNIGLIIHPFIPGLAASPDGLLEKSGDLVEIKCPFSAVPYKTLRQAYLSKERAICSLFVNDKCMEIHFS